MTLLIDRTLHLPLVARGSVIDSYVFRDAVRSGFVLALGPISLVNHSARPNCCVEFEQLQSGELTIKLVSRRMIRRGEELTIHYGVKPWWWKEGKRHA